MVKRSAQISKLFDELPKVERPTDKIRSLEELSNIAGGLRQRGNRVVQAHGTFDLLHIGHIRHLEAGRGMGDALIVTITADQFVNKGPGRPVFNESYRAEMLATLEFVDWVGICDAPDAIGVIELVQPDIYVKGQDYQNPEGDVTGKITKERLAVEAAGGEMAFTEDITFSSSQLINRHLNVFEPHIREHLHEYRSNGGLDEILSLIEQVKDYRVLLVGDAIIDDYQYILPMGKSPKENMIATRYQDRELFAGGVFAAANHVASFCAEVDVITCLGESESFEEFIRGKLHPNVRLHPVMRPGASTTIKRRFVDPSYMRKLFEVYFMDDDPLAAPLQENVNNLISDIAPNCDLVIATDFGHGLLDQSAVKTMSADARFLAVNTQSNSANMGYNLITKYAEANYICIDAPEARLAAGDRVSPLGEVAHSLIDSRIDCDKLIVTQGKHGCVTYERGGVVHTIPAFAKNVLDTVGAGDAFLSVTSPLVAAGAPMHKVGFIGNVVGALMVEIIGNREAIDKPSLIKAITGLLK